MWTQVCDEIGVLMAIPAKRQCGTWVNWLGAGIWAQQGVAWVPLRKKLTALNRLYAVLLGTITFGDYHKLLGLLEHLVFLQGMKRQVMYGLWAPFKGGVQREPNQLLQATEAICRQCKRWDAAT